MAVAVARRLVKRVVRSVTPSRYLVWSGDPSAKRVALTFDDGPNPEYTPGVLQILREAGARATFFVVGQNVERHPALVEAMIAAGHELGNHTYSHVDLQRAGPRVGREELARTAALLRERDRRFLGLFRPPWGRLGVAGAAYALSSGNRAVMWSLDSMDYHRDSADRIVDAVRGASLSGGAILLFHDDNPHTLAALPAVIEDLRRRGFTFCTVGELL